MATTPTTPIQTPPTLPELALAIIVALADIRQVPVAELEAEMAAGNLEMASPEAVAAISAVEHQYGRRLAKVEDLEPEQLTSVANLADLLHRRWPTGIPMPSESET